MAVPKQKFREIVLLLLYSYDLAVTTEDEMQELVMETLEVTKKNVKEAFERMLLVFEKIDLIDKLIRETSTTYDLGRIQRLEKNVLRLGIFEMLYDDSIPEKVAIHEAMRLARKFSTKEAASFVNALLDTIYKKSIGEKEDNELLSESTEKLLQSEEIAKEVALKDIAVPLEET
ncbi:MAG: transcription antitermination factor NusB [Chlamydiales bacterium]|nr:transcription antitermination factor NusB [Chlamydiales bacterium]